MARPPILVRLVQGRMLPVPPGEGVDGVLVITPETEIRVRDSAWARRRIARGDLVRVEAERFETMADALDPATLRYGDSRPGRSDEIEELDLDSLAAELDDLESDLTEE